MTGHATPTMAIRILLGIIAFAAPFGVLLAVQTVNASHAGTAVQIGGRNLQHGYFTGSSTGGDLTTSTNVINNGLNDNAALSGTQAQRKAEFIRQVKNFLNNGSSRDQRGAGFIIQTMRGEPWDRQYKPSSADIADWEARINDSAVSIGRNGSYSYTYNSGYFSNVNDDAFLRYPGTRLSLIFTYNGSTRYVVKIDCANPVGDFPGLPVPTSPATIESQSLINGSTTSPITISASTGNVEFHHRVRVTNYNGMSHSVGYRIDRSVATGGATCGDSGWTAIKTSTLPVTSNGDKNVWGPSIYSGWNRETTTRICQRLVITSYGGANLSGSATTTVYANVVDGNITVIASADKNYVEAGEDFSMRGQVRARASSEDAPFRLSYDITYTVTNIPGLIPPDPRTGSVIVSSTSDITRTRDFNGTMPVNAPAGGTVCVTVTVSSPTEDRYFSPSGANTDSICITVVNKPIVSVRGGDVAAGAGFAPACASTPNAAVVGWNTNTGAYDGAGADHGVFALGRITGFASAKINAGGATPPRSLAFANTPAASGEEYGGSFGSLPCITDHFGLMPPNAQSMASLASLNNNTPTGTYYTTNSNNMPSNLMFNGRQVTVYVEGDVFLGGNVLYNRSGSWPVPSDIPGFKLVVRGDIFIRNTVTELNGIYIAQGNGTNGGNIYTCAQGPGTGDAVNTGNTSSSILYARCNTPLTVNGVFVANKIYFTRTYGTSFNNQPAERFNYLPELWLTPWPDTSEGNSTKYDSITGLPPIL